MRGLWLLGELRALEGRPREALDLSETAVALDPDDAEARACLAARYLSLGFYEAALVASVHALDLDPLWHLPHETRVVCFVRLGRLSEAHAAADQLCREDPDTPTGEFLRASVRIAEGDLEGAEAALAPRRHGLSHPDDGGRAEVVRGLVAALRGEEDEARRVLVECCGLAPPLPRSPAPAGARSRGDRRGARAPRARHVQRELSLARERAAGEERLSQSRAFASASRSFTASGSATWRSSAPGSRRTPSSSRFPKPSSAPLRDSPNPS